MIKIRHVFVLALALVAWADAPGLAKPTFPIVASPTMPPRRVADCVTYALLDNKCTADWYSCSADKRVCVQAWNECCTLPGNQARTTIVSAPQVP